MAPKTNIEPGVYVERHCGFCGKSVGCNPYWRVDGDKIQCYACRGKARKEKRKKKRNK